MLKNLTPTFKNKCNEIEISLSEHIILDGITIPIKAELNDDCYKDGNFIGTFIFKEIKFETDNKYNFKQKEFEYYKKVSGESVKIGTFITTEVNDNDTNETVKVVAMDYGLKSQVEYTSFLDYSSGTVTLLDVWNENCELCGLESGITNFTNSNFIVDSDQFSGTGATRRDVFGAIAKASCDFVKIGNDDKIYLILKNETNEIVEDYTDLEDKRDTHEINAVSLGMSQVEGNNVVKIAEGVSEGQENWLVINDNLFAYTQEKRQQLIDGIFDKINGFGYSSFKTETSFKPYLTCGDLIKFKRKDGVLVDTILLRYKHDFDEITLEAPSIIKATVVYEKPQTAMDIARKNEIIVNQHEGKITQLTSKTENLDITVNNNYQEIVNKFEGYTPTSQTVQLEKAVTQIQTDSYTKTEINTKLTDGSVTKVHTVSGTFDENGMHYEKTGAPTNSTINEKGVEVDNSTTGEELLFAGYDEQLRQTIVRTENLTVRRYFVIGENSRFEDYEDEEGNIGGGIFIL